MLNTLPSIDQRQSPTPAYSKRSSRPAKNGNAKATDAKAAEAKSALGKSKAAPLTPEQEAQFIARYSHVVRQIAGGFQRKVPRNVLRDDLLAAGMSGLWDAIRKHAHEQSVNFDWYVRVRIRGAILDELRAQDWLPRRARAAAAEAAQAAGSTISAAPMVLRLDEVSEVDQARCMAAPDTVNAETMAETRSVNDKLSRAVDQLPERERHIVSMHYFRGVRFKDLGQLLGVSEPRVSQLHSRAMNRLKGLLENAA
jgi:RNA polymerase sigma factor for flagellar operon FliA